MSSPRINVQVARKQHEAAGICSFELVGVNGELLPAFTAGAHIDVHLRGGITRQYSLCNHPVERHRYMIAVLNEATSRGGSRAMHEEVHAGGVLEISAPRNRFELSRAGRRQLLLAGGIGVTPILCMAEQLASERRDFSLHYCCRSRERAAFLDRISSSNFADRVQLHFDDADPLQKIDLAEVLASSSTDTDLYVCGPQGFMNAVLDAARAKGWPEDCLHYEFFAADVARSGDGFQIKLASSGKIVVVAPEQSVVEALAAEGIEIPVSCGQGICGTCTVGVLAGEPDHRDLFLSAEEQARNDRFTPCCSRAKSKELVLDL